MLVCNQIMRPAFTSTAALFDDEEDIGDSFVDAAVRIISTVIIVRAANEPYKMDDCY